MLDKMQEACLKRRLLGIHHVGNGAHPSGAHPGRVAHHAYTAREEAEYEMTAHVTCTCLTRR
jgi:hypothetical protein